MKKTRKQFLLSFYGDDFTGSTDVMETLAIHGLPTILFLKTPSPEEVENIKLKRNAGGHKLKAFGVAGIARSLDPQAMEKELEPIFAAMSKFSTEFFLYKVCSTLDSAPTVGNIGTAIDTALKYFPAKRIPCIVGAPFLNRFVVFGNLFARLDDTTYRLDRHPVMSVHPVTPMQESDIARHLARQSKRMSRSIDILQMRSGTAMDLADFEGNDDVAPFIIFDTLSNTDLEFLGEYLYQNWEGTTQLLLGSSGISFGLAKYLSSESEQGSKNNYQAAEPVSQILVGAGSCSPVTERQINFSLARGYVGIRLQVSLLHTKKERHMADVMLECQQTLSQGKSVIIYTALGPADPSIAEINARKIVNLNTLIGDSIGEIFANIVQENPKLRCVVVGGDTSGYVSRYLGIYALEMLAPIAPGAPLCVAHASNPAFDGMEVALKGGQNGKDDYFQRILMGK